MTAHYPLRFEFARDPQEHVEVMFAGSSGILSARKTAGWFAKKVLTGLAVVLIIVLLVPFLRSQGLRPDQFNILCAGFLMGIGLYILFQILSYRSTRRKYRATLRPNDNYVVELDEQGIRSTSNSLTLESRWNNIADVRIGGDILLIRDEVMIHYIPARALPNSLGLVELQEIVQSRLATERAMQ